MLWIKNILTILSPVMKLYTGNVQIRRKTGEEMLEMDDLDLDIASKFDNRASISCSDVARQLGLSTSTVRRRMARMQENGEIESRVFVDVDTFPEGKLSELNNLEKALKVVNEGKQSPS